MLPGDKVLFFTKPPSVAQARPIRRQWLVNSCQSGGKPRRDRDHGAILLMNYLNGRNNNVLTSRARLGLISRRNISRDDKNFVRRGIFSNEGRLFVRNPRAASPFVRQIITLEYSCMRYMRVDIINPQSMFLHGNNVMRH